MTSRKHNGTVTVGQVRGVSRLLARKCRTGETGIGIEVRGTSRIEAIDSVVETVQDLSKRLNLLLIYVDPAIYDATGR
jgi:hypothetical protein